ncbi:hypothetical protein [Candidatus Binatus sp.]|uniref:hypothetical protein n=1 Tax=Candidatus Binatus sp. TaxID=2811406 RepID=UPI003C75202B
MKLSNLHSVVLTMLAIIIGSMGLIVAYFLALVLLVPVAFTCRGARVLNYLHLENSAEVHCACDSGSKPGCYP